MDIRTNLVRTVMEQGNCARAMDAIGVEIPLASSRISIVKSYSPLWKQNEHERFDQKAKLLSIEDCLSAFLFENHF